MDRIVPLPTTYIEALIPNVTLFGDKDFNKVIRIK